MELHRIGLESSWSNTVEYTDVLNNVGGVILSGYEGGANQNRIVSNNLSKRALELTRVLEEFYRSFFHKTYLRQPAYPREAGKDDLRPSRKAINFCNPASVNPPSRAPSYDRRKHTLVIGNEKYEVQPTRGLVSSLYERSQVAYLREKIKEARGEQRFLVLVLTSGLALLHSCLYLLDCSRATSFCGGPVSVLVHLFLSLALLAWATTIQCVGL